VTRRRAVRLAVIGAGRMGRVHLQALRAATSCRAVAVADPSVQARAAAGADGLATYPCARSLFAAGGFDAVIVATPTDLHLDTMRMLLEEGVPVLCEKPCGASVAEAREIATLAAERGVPVQVGFFRRFIAELADFRERLRAGELGDVAHLATFQWDGQPPPAAFYASSGGVFADMAIHDFDEIRWLSGQEFESVAGFGAPLRDAPFVAGDPGHVQLAAQLSGGALATISLGRRFAPGDALRVEATGTRGTACCAFMWPPNEERVFVEAVRRQDEAFAAAARGAPVVGATPADAVAALQVAELAQRSVQLRAPNVA
jgi:myo-inositol 2-dehydrogenase/D-chiro-inositol 1-dehydrogenase